MRQSLHLFLFCFILSLLFLSFFLPMYRLSGDRLFSSSSYRWSSESSLSRMDSVSSESLSESGRRICVQLCGRLFQRSLRRRTDGCRERCGFGALSVYPDSAGRMYSMGLKYPAEFYPPAYSDRRSRKSGKYLWRRNKTLRMRSACRESATSLRRVRRYRK